jgi:CDP-glycerol glycerophosphotransferase (TagB/SpsB family)
MPATQTKLFANSQPTVLYNPHFDTTISSWNAAETVIERFREDGRYNLIVAPHIRIAEDMDDAERARWMAMAEDDRIIVDLSSDRLIDMTYVRAADIYLGDMSSQLYEFLAEPRPVAFVNTHMAEWRDDPRYAGWHLGEVAELPGSLMPTIDAAIANHAKVIGRQREAVTRAFGEIDGACERAAHIVVDAIAREVSVPASSSAVSFA